MEVPNIVSQAQSTKKRLADKKGRQITVEEVAANKEAIHTLTDNLRREEGKK